MNKVILFNRIFLRFMKEHPNILNDLPVGTRLLYRAKNDWRCAVISRFGKEKVTLTICSPNGRTYRLRRLHKTKILVEGKILLLESDVAENWKENFTNYDIRW